MCLILVTFAKRSFRSALCAVVAFTFPSVALSVIDVRMQTDLGGIDILLRDDVAPLTVANFLDYVNVEAYDGVFIHRNIPGFVVQSGGFKFNPADGGFFEGGASHIPVNDPVVNEAGLPGALSNIRGTIAMAKVGGDPDSATSEWFFNLVDNSENLDNQNGGFTVFAEVQGNDMDVVDAIAAQDVCKQLSGIFGFICAGTSFSDTIIVDATNSIFSTDRLLLVRNIGFDTDTDGVIDRVEDAAPNGGDSNNDLIPDSTQIEVAAFATRSGDDVTISVEQPLSLASMDVLAGFFSLANPPQSFCNLQGLDFRQDFNGFDVTGLAAGGGATVLVTLPAGEVPDTYHNYGPTPDNPEPHWYEFLFDGETGAELSGNVVTLHFVDGKRGDADLDGNNGVIVNTGGSAIVLDMLIDEDGISEVMEDAAPNEGDGNNDGTIDSTQGNVASFTDLNGKYVTIDAGPAVPLRVIDTNSQGLPSPDPDILDDMNFTHGFFSFEMCEGPVATVSIILPEFEAPNSYFMFGPTPENPDPHYYEFLFDGETGTETNGNVITLHFVDGKRGDSDLLANGAIVVSPGGPGDRPDDTDGIPDETENSGPNNGDGNNDGVPDSIQGHVASFPDLDGNYVTLSSDPAFKLQTLLFRQITASVVDPDIPPAILPDIDLAKPPAIIEGFNLSHEFITFEVANLNPGDAAVVTLLVPDGEQPLKYFKFGPTPSNPVDHWYDFTFDGETGVQINGSIITLHFVDGKRGDSDLTVNGIIADPGAPAVKARNSGGGGSGGGGGGGCSSSNASRAGTSAQAGAWYLLLLLLSIQGLRLRMRG